MTIIRRSLVNLVGFLYRSLLKPLFFLFTTPETIHHHLTQRGEMFGSFALPRLLFSSIFTYSPLSLRQTVTDITFAAPVGLAAGFDYEARLPQFLPCLGFGFGTVGTVTNKAYGGNSGLPYGRLPRSRSLMVNKGFKNLGITDTLKKLVKIKSPYPVGLSIGKTNLPSVDTLPKAVKDITASFSAVLKSKFLPAYFELNISCPNLSGCVSFYKPSSLQTLLSALGQLKIPAPIFVKMPICLSDQEFLKLLEVISRHDFVKGVIIGNLQTDRTDPALNPSEVSRFPQGNFSGKPCFKDSNHFIALAYQHYSPRLIIIGCGGVFSAEDAYTKIKLGASLVQLITGLIFMGPQLVSQINYGLEDLLKKDGYNHLSQAVGTAAGTTIS